ncbi:hypothetical protein EG327_011223 [Venturia inaequalis]|uniref:Uncharacterized protein n=1 Tax=Venturia inaequalis TaxID=5025 RepID=A0A8H3VPH3_VENIN|nr:hypothetical protein EG327_011223 [Venturia inaequalis]
MGAGARMSSQGARHREQTGVPIRLSLLPDRNNVNQRPMIWQHERPLLHDDPGRKGDAEENSAALQLSRGSNSSAQLAGRKLAINRRLWHSQKSKMACEKDSCWTDRWVLVEEDAYLALLKTALNLSWNRIQLPEPIRAIVRLAKYTRTIRGLNSIDSGPLIDRDETLEAQELDVEPELCAQTPRSILEA